MPSSKTIKIVKREQRQLARKRDHPKTQSQARRELFKTVKVWIEEQKEAKKDLQSLAKALCVSAVTQTRGDAE